MKFSMLLVATTIAAFAVVPVASAKPTRSLPSAFQQGYGNNGSDVVWWWTAAGYDSTSCTEVLNQPSKFPRGQVKECRARKHRR